jgi:uncharacterized membrane-anchored protein
MLKSKSTRIAFCGLACILILVGMLVKHAWPLWTGQVIYLHVRPVDPRDVFRGDYVTLNYDITNALHRATAIGELKEQKGNDPMQGKVVYVQLKQIPSTTPGVPYIYEAKSISNRLEPSQINIKGRIANRYSQNIQFGIDAFFVQEGQGQAIEQALRDRNQSVFAEVALSSSGNARIKNLIIDGRPIAPDAQ